MPCEQFREQIQLFVDGYLTDAEKQALKAHVLQCPACADYLRDMVALSRTVEKLRVPVPEGLHESLMQAYRSERNGVVADRFDVVTGKADVVTGKADYNDDDDDDDYDEFEAPRASAIGGAGRGAFAPMRFIRRNPVVAAAAVLVLVVGVVWGAGSLRGEAGAPAQTTAGMGTTLATSTTPLTTAAQSETTTPVTVLQTGMDTSSPVTTAPESMSEREQAAYDAITAHLPISLRNHGFQYCAFMKLEQLPQGVNDWEHYTAGVYRGGEVDLVYIVADRARYEELSGAPNIDESFCFEAPFELDILQEDAQEGLIVLALPRGA